MPRSAAGYKEPAVRIVSVKVRAALLYLFSGMLVYLAGVYVSPLYYYLYIVLSLFPVFSALQVALTAITLRCSQEFDSDHAVKGGTIGYHLSLRANRLLATGGVHIRFTPIHPRLPDRLPDITVVMNGRGAVEEHYTIRCLYRGSYMIGIEALEVRDVLGWLTVRKPASSRTFEVFPRITPIEVPMLGRDGHLPVDRARSTEHDPALFEGLETYREGSSVKHIAWKKFLTTGVPFLKHFGPRADSGVRIYIDLREGSSEAALATEDCSIEVAVSLVKGFLEVGMPVTVSAFGERDFLFQVNGHAEFAEFYRSTAGLAFRRGAPSPLDRISTGRGRTGNAVHTLIITHLADPAILGLAAGADELAVLVNLHGLDPEARRRVRDFRASLLDEGGSLFLVEGADSLKEDSQRWQSRSM